MAAVQNQKKGLWGRKKKDEAAGKTTESPSAAPEVNKAGVTHNTATKVAVSEVKKEVTPPKAPPKPGETELFQLRIMSGIAGLLSIAFMALMQDSYFPAGIFSILAAAILAGGTVEEMNKVKSVRDMPISKLLLGLVLTLGSIVAFYLLEGALRYISALTLYAAVYFGIILMGRYMTSSRTATEADLMHAKNKTQQALEKQLAANKARLEKERAKEAKKNAKKKVPASNAAPAATDFVEAPVKIAAQPNSEPGHVDLTNIDPDEFEFELADDK